MDTEHAGNAPDGEAGGAEGPAHTAPPAGLTVTEAATSLGLSPAEVRRLIRAGHLPAQRFVGLLGVEYRVREADLEALRSRQEAGEQELPDDLGPLDGSAGAALPPALSPSAQVRRLAEEVAVLQEEVAGLRAEIATSAHRAQEREAALRAEVHAALARQGAPQTVQDDRRAGDAADQRRTEHPRRPWWSAWRDARRRAGRRWPWGRSEP